MNKKRSYSRHIVLFLIVLVTYAYFFPRWADWNQNSRLDQVLAIVDRGVLYIDDYYANTGDYALYQGHYYSDKAPGVSFLGVPVYGLYKIVAEPVVNRILPRIENSTAFAGTLNESGTGLLADKIKNAIILYWLSFFCVSIPAALLSVFLFELLGSFTDHFGLRTLIVFAYCLGTIAFPYSNAFMGHQLSAALLMVSFFILFRLKQNFPVYLLVGFLLGYSVISEYETVIIAFFIVLYALFTARKKLHLLGILIGGAIPLLLASIYNFSIYSTPLPVAYKYSLLFPEHFNTGILGFMYPKAEALWGLSFSPYRGLFFVSPFLIFAIIGVVYMVRNKKFRLESLLVIGIFLVYFLFISSSDVWPGGFAVGPRYLSPTVPFLMIPIAYLANDFRKQKPLFLLFLIAVLASFIILWLQTISGQQFPDYSLNPLLQYSIPKFLVGDIARNVGMVLGLKKWSSLIPLGVIYIIFGGVLWKLNSEKKRADSQN